MRFEIFNDPLYNAEATVEFNSADVVSIEEKTASLLLRGSHQVTQVSLRNGSVHLLRGWVQQQIEDAQNEKAA